MNTSALKHLFSVLLVMPWLCMGAAKDTAAGTSPWPMPRHDAQGTAKGEHAGPRIPFVRWSAPTDYFVNTGPVMGSDGSLYFYADDHVYSVSSNGSRNWRVPMDHSSGDPGIQCPAVGSGDVVFIRGGGSAEFLHALDSEDGHELWNQEIGKAYTNPFIGPDGTVYITGDKILYAFGPGGNLVWKTDSRDPPFETGFNCGQMALSPDGATLYVGDSASCTYALRTSDGAIVWKSETQNLLFITTGEDGTLYSSQYYYHPYVTAIDPTGGLEKWSVELDGSACKLAVDGDRIYAATQSNTLYALTSSGSTLWTIEVPGDISSCGMNGSTNSPIVDASGVVYVTTTQDGLFAFDPETGDQLWNYAEKGGLNGMAIGSTGMIYTGGARALYAIGEAIAPSAAFVGTPLTGKPPLKVQFKDYSKGDITSRLWNFGDGKTSTSRNPSYTYYKPGKYTLTLTVTGPAGKDTETKTGYITVSEPPPEAAFTATPLSGKAPLRVNFKNQSNGSITSCSWSFGDGTASKEKNPTHTYRKPGTYTVKLTVKGPGGSDTATRYRYIRAVGSLDGV